MTTNLEGGERPLRVTLDPNYAPRDLYRRLKLLCLLYDEVYVWYPVQRNLESYIGLHEFLDLVTSGVIVPIGESRWWERRQRRQWPGFAGEWTELDEYLSRNSLFKPFAEIVGDESGFRARIEELSHADAGDVVFRQLVAQHGQLPYRDPLLSRDPAEWFSACFRSHREVSEALRSVELVAPNHERPWEYLFGRMAIQQVDDFDWVAIRHGGCSSCC